MTFRLRTILAGLCALAIARAEAASLPPQTAAYSATADVQVDKAQYNASILADHGRARCVVQTPLGPQTVIVDLTQGKAYLLQPFGALALDLKSRTGGVDLAQLSTGAVQPVGREMIDGLKVVKYRVAAHPSPEASFSGFLWATDDGIYVKAEGTGVYRKKSSRVTMRLTGITRDAPDPAALAIPNGMGIVDADPLVRQLLEPPVER